MQKEGSKKFPCIKLGKGGRQAKNFGQSLHWRAFSRKLRKGSTNTDSLANTVTKGDGK